MRRILFALTAGALLPGCSTVSFSPPSVPIAYQGDPQGSQTCKRNGTGVTVNRDVHGAWTVVGAFIAAYACSRDSANDGRQIFDLPAFASTTGAATAVALGATPVATIGIIGTAASSVFNAGKSYYDPKAKAAIYNQAVAALECIQQRSVGAASTKIDESKKNAALLSYALSAAGEPGPQISFSTDEKYFMIVTTAAFQVRDILSTRLSTVGTLDASTIADQIKKAADDAKAKQDKADQAAQNTAVTPPTPQELALFAVPHINGVSESATLGLTLARIQQARDNQVINLDLDALQPTLDECVATAKL